MRASALLLLSQRGVCYMAVTLALRGVVEPLTHLKD